MRALPCRANLRPDEGSKLCATGFAMSCCRFTEPMRQAGTLGMVKCRTQSQVSRRWPDGFAGILEQFLDVKNLQTGRANVETSEIASQRAESVSRPLGSDDFLDYLERNLDRHMKPEKRRSRTIAKMKK